MKKTIAQELNIKKFPFEIKDEKGNEIYYESSNGYWHKRKFDSKGNLIYYENSNGTWHKSEYDSNGNIIYFEDSNGYWWKAEYDSKGNIIYYEDSTGRIEDKRPKKVELTLDEIANKFGINVKDLRIKD
jgi:hypothetical protein